MKRDVWLFLTLGCILILFLEAPAALSSVTADLGEPYDPWETPPAAIEASTDASAAGGPAAERGPATVSRRE